MRLGIMVLPQIYGRHFRSNVLKYNPDVVVINPSMKHIHKILRACNRMRSVGWGGGGIKLITFAGKTTDLITRS
jgi:hypothetical protein